MNVEKQQMFNDFFWIDYHKYLTNLGMGEDTIDGTRME